MQHPKPGHTYWGIGARGQSGYWVIILGSRNGTRIDPPADAPDFIGATLFTTEQAAIDYRAKLTPNQFGASSDFEILNVLYHGNDQFALANYTEHHEI